MEEKMFCFQCEQRMNEKACTVSGVCGKTPEIAALQDLIIYQLKGIASYADEILKKEGEIGDYIIKEIEDGLFMTLTNVNFNLDDHIYRLKRLQEIKEMLRNEGVQCDKEECAYTLSRTNNEILRDAKEKACILCDGETNADIRSLRETIKYGLKGIAAYGHQARALGYKSEKVDKFYIEALDYISDKDISQGELLELLIKTGEMSVEVMRLLDECNTNVYSHPEITEVSRGIKKGPFIIVSGHDLKDLEELLKQTEDKGINIYTHGEMLPANSYPELKKYKHLVGNFGTAWQNQRKEFDGIQGCILMTTNCIMKPLESYKDRIFTTSVVGHEDLINIKDNMSGMKDFSPIINKALELGGFTEDKEEKKIIIGFGRDATLKNAGKIVEMVKEGKIKHFFLVGGCDGTKEKRSYYTEFAKQVPKDCVILTLACGKYRMNDLDLGDIDGIPRLLDIGQCNDAYSAVRIAMALAEAFNTDINSLPLSIVLSWYEQKAVADLLALIYLGVKNMKLGPSLPSFISENVLKILVDHYNLGPTTTPEKDIEELLKK